MGTAVTAVSANKTEILVHQSQVPHHGKQFSLFQILAFLMFLMVVRLVLSVEM